MREKFDKIVNFLLYTSYISHTFVVSNPNPMKKIIPVFSVILLCAILNVTPAFSQGSVTSSNGYTVNIVVMPKAIVPTSSSCLYGYNYNVRLDYSVTITGSNRPSSLYTLQGRVGCGSSSHFFDLPNGASAGSVISQSNVWRSQSDCGTATVANLGCNTVSIEIEGPGISARTISFTVAESPLPVTLTAFTAIAANNKVKLNWSTANEFNSKLFNVQRSVDGTVWSTIQTVAAAGNAADARKYEVYDVNPVNGTAQYRLEQVDMDGKTEYSSTRVVKIVKGISQVSVFPVPNSGNTIHFTGIADPVHTLMVVQNMTGVSVYTTNLKSSTAELPQLKPGMYIIRLTNTITGEATSLRYMKI